MSGQRRPPVVSLAPTMQLSGRAGFPRAAYPAAHPFGLEHGAAERPDPGGDVGHGDPLSIPLSIPEECGDACAMPQVNLVHVANKPDQDPAISMTPRVVGDRSKNRRIRQARPLNVRISGNPWRRA